MRCLLLLTVAVSTSCAALDPGPRALQDGYREEFLGTGFHATARAHAGWLDGEFDGDTTLSGPQDIIVLPDGGAGFGWEAGLGDKRAGLGWELTYGSMSYDGDLAGVSADVDQWRISLNALYHVRNNEALQPYVLVGLFYSEAELENASTDVGMTVTGDATLSAGLGGSLGAGLTCWLGPRLALDFRLLGSYRAYNRAEGVAGDSDEILGDVDGISYGASIGLNWILVPRSGDPADLFP